MEVLFHQRLSLQSTVLCHVQTCHSDRKCLDHLPPLSRSLEAYCLGHGFWRSNPKRSVRIVHIGSICCSCFFVLFLASKLFRNGWTLCFGCCGGVTWKYLRVISTSTGTVGFPVVVYRFSSWGRVTSLCLVRVPPPPPQDGGKGDGGGNVGQLY